MSATMSLIVALKSYFGFKPGQTTGDFMTEIKALDEADRAYFKRLLEDILFVQTTI